MLTNILNAGCSARAGLYCLCCQPGLHSANSSSCLKSRLRTKLDECAISFFGPAEWIYLPSELQMITDTISFKKKKYIFIIRHSLLTNSRCFSFSSISIACHFSCFLLQCTAGLYSVSEILSNFNCMHVCTYASITTANICSILQLLYKYNHDDQTKFVGPRPNISYV